MLVLCLCRHTVYANAHNLTLHFYTTLMLFLCLCLLCLCCHTDTQCHSGFSMLAVLPSGMFTLCLHHSYVDSWYYAYAAIHTINVTLVLVCLHYSHFNINPIFTLCFHYLACCIILMLTVCTTSYCVSMHNLLAYCSTG